MSKKPIHQDEFIDLYDALDLSQKADATKIRKRINELYLEAQQNLDHRNPKKRIRYQEMYEIIVPQARHLLLDEGRRAEYDQYLKAYQTGTKVQTSTEEVQQRKFETPNRVTVTERLAEEEGIDPKKLEEKRENTWEQWKQGLEVLQEEPQQDKTNAVNPGAPKANIPQPEQPQSGEPQTTPQRAPDLRTADDKDPEQKQNRGFSPVALHSGEAKAAAAATQEKQQKRNKKRNRIIEQRANNQKLMRTLIVGVPVFVVSALVLYFGTNYLTTAGILIGTFGEVVNLGWFPVAVIIGFVSGRNAGQMAYSETVGNLSRLPYEELKRK